MELNDKQKAFISDQSEHIRLLAPAGSGKTFSILKKCEFIHGMDENKKIQIFTFTNVAKTEIISRLETDNNFILNRNNVDVHTLNQFGFKIIKRKQTKLQLKKTKKDKYYLVENNLRPIWMQDKKIDSVLNSRSQTYSDLIDVFNNLKSIGFVHDFKDYNELYSHFYEHRSWLENNGLGRYFEDNIERTLCEMNIIEAPVDWKRFLRFWSKSTEHLWQSKLISFEDQKYWAYLALKGGNSVRTNAIDYIFVDEFQDINPLDLNFLLQIRKLNKSSLILVGDDDQAIYEWRGSSPKFIIYPEKYTGLEYSDHVFEYNYRSPSKLLDVSQKLIKINRSRVDKKVTSLNKDSIEILVIPYRSPSSYLDDLYSYCKTSFDSNIPNDLAIISRKRAQLIPIQILLTSREINFYAKEDLNVLLSEAFDDLKKVLEICAAKGYRKSSSEIVKDLMHLVDLIYKFPINMSNKNKLTYYFLNKNLTTLESSIDLIRSYSQPIKTNNIEGQDSLKVYNVLNTLFFSDSVSESIQTIGQHFQGLKQHFKKAEDDIFYSDPPFIFLADYAERYKDNYWDFIDHVGKAIAKMKSKIPDDSGDDDYFAPVHLMTALRAKGKEFNKVIILDANDDIWPSKQAETKEQFEQERRIFYVAVTRAMKQLNIFTTKRYLSTYANQSRYISEMGLG